MVQKWGAWLLKVRHSLLLLTVNKRETSSTSDYRIFFKNKKIILFSVSFYMSQQPKSEQAYNRDDLRKNGVFITENLFFINGAK